MKNIRMKGESLSRSQIKYKCILFNVIDTKFERFIRAERSCDSGLERPRLIGSRFQLSIMMFVVF